VRIAVLSIGDELMCGEIVDTNFAHIAACLLDVGLPVDLHLTVGDDWAAIAVALRQLSAEHDAVIATGGLGPTGDDRTSAAAAEACGRPLELNPAARDHIRLVAGRFGGDLPPANDKQALIPAGADLIPNPGGTACGFHLGLSGCRCFFLPGVPGEMRGMLAASVLPWLLKHHPPAAHHLTRVFRVFGPSEAELETLLADLAHPGSGVAVAFCVEFPAVLVKLRATGSAADPVAAALETVAVEARRRLGANLIGGEGDRLEAVVGRLLLERGLTLATAESCTGGLIAKQLTDIPGSSAWFLEGAVTYANAAKMRQLGVPQALLEEHGAVSTQVAEAMAQGMRRAAGSDLALAVTGIAGPDGGTAEKPVGTVYIALADRDGCAVRRCLFSGSREEIRTVTAVTALDWLRRRLLT
jgi:competence/damage-inducible protein CinA-like protein